MRATRGGDSGADAPEAVFRAFAEAVSNDAEPLAEQVKKLLDLIEAGDEQAAAGFAASLSANLASYLPEDPESATVLAEAMAEKYAQAWEEAHTEAQRHGEGIFDQAELLALANANPDQPRGQPDNAGQFASSAAASSAPSVTTEKTEGVSHEHEIKPATSETVAKFLQDPPDRISPDEADALLAAGFEDKDGAGNTVKYGQLLRDHIDSESHSEKDRIARKQRLGVAVKVIRAATPQPSSDAAKPNERVYTGTWNGKAYVGIADEHGEMNAMLMVSYRRDGRHDEK